MGEAPVLRLQGIDVRLGGRRRWLRPSIPPVRAVTNVSLDVVRGEIFGLVGESGCGKTTLARTILGLQRESAGDIWLNGKLVSGLERREARRARSTVHYVYQDAAAALDPWWSIGHTMEEGLIVQGMRDSALRRQRITEALSSVGLDADTARRYPHEMSGGQLRRVALARVLVLRPSVIVLDEPTSGLDMSVQANILNLLLDLRRQFELTYIFISHDLSVVEKLCDKVAVMYLGRLVEVAPAGMIFNGPRHPYTRALLASAPTLAPAARAAPAIKGDPPSTTTLIAGCPFAGRCPNAEPACQESEQLFEQVKPSHQVACRRWRELTASEATAPLCATGVQAARA